MPLLIWAENATDEKQYISTCGSLDAFYIEAFDVIDETGNRVLSNAELLSKNTGKNSGGLEERRLPRCFGNMAIAMPPHSCRHGNLDNPEMDFVKNLDVSYTLTPGRYRILPRAKDDAKHKPTEQGLDITVLP